MPDEIAVNEAPLGALSNDVREHTARMSASADALRGIARGMAMARVHNDLRLALHSIAMDIDRAIIDLEVVADRHFNKITADREEASRNIMRAAIAGRGVDPDR